MTLLGRKLPDLLENDRNFVGKHEDEIVVLHLLQRLRQRIVLVENDLHLVFAHAAFEQSFLDQARGIAYGAAATILVLANDHAIELRGKSSDGAKVFIAPVT